MNDFNERRGTSTIVKDLLWCLYQSAEDSQSGESTRHALEQCV